MSVKVTCVFQIRFSPEIASRQAAKRANFVSLDKKKKASGEGKTGGVMVVVVVTDRLRESFWRVSSYMEGNAYAYAYAYALCMQESTTSRTNVGLSTGFFGCV